MSFVLLLHGAPLFFVLVTLCFLINRWWLVLHCTPPVGSQFVVPFGFLRAGYVSSNTRLVNCVFLGEFGGGVGDGSFVVGGCVVGVGDSVEWHAGGDVFEFVLC